MFFTVSILLAAVLILLYKIASIYHAADEIQAQLAEHMEMDTNTGIDISCADPKMKALAAGLDRQLKALRRKELVYTRGDAELKTAVTNISHDIRTPLTAVCGYLSLLKEENLTDAGAQYLGILENRVEALKELSEELFRYSVILSLDSYGEKEELSLAAVLEECIAGYYGAILKAGMRPEIRLTKNAVKRHLNRQAVSRIFSNIISNAVKYSDGDFTIRLDAQGRICFENQAQKLDPVSAARLSERFYTVEDGRGSTGLGLSIARTLTEKMGGKIRAEYREGVLYFYVWFPE